MIPSSTKKKTGVVRLPTIKPHPFVRDFHFEFPSSWHCTPSCLVSRQSGAVFHPGPSPVVSAKAGLPLNLSLNPGIAFARSDFSDIAPSVTLLDRFFCCYHLDYPAGTGCMAMLRSIEPPPVLVSFRQQQPVVSRMLKQPSSGLANRCCRLVSNQFSRVGGIIGFQWAVNPVSRLPLNGHSF